MKRTLILAAALLVVLAAGLAPVSVGAEETKIVSSKKVPEAISIEDFSADPPACLYAAEFVKGKRPDKLEKVVFITFQPGLGIVNVILKNGRRLSFSNEERSSFQEDLSKMAKAFYFPSVNEGNIVGLFSESGRASWIWNAFRLSGTGYASIRY